jgi:ABC-type antimicrobial peptide transport system permease subunit
VGLGLMIGLPLAFACSQLVAAYTDSLRTFDLFAFSVVPLVLAGIALGAAWWPARRSARIPPTEALRQD